MKKDLNIVADLYKDANKFTNKKNILNWTKENLENFSRYHLVFEKKNRIAGAISGVVSKNKIAIIEDVAIHKSYRGKKIGSKLIRNLMDKFRKDGIKKVRLWVHWTDAQAIPFYYRHGFRIIRFQKTKNIKYVPNGEDILILEKRLSQ